MFMRTARLLLRPVFPEDWGEVFDGIGQRDIVRMLARAPWPYSPADARAFCNRPHNVHDLKFAITIPGSQGAPVIGGVGLDPVVSGDGKPAGLSAAYELGYWVGRKWQRRGYASEAVNGVLEMARALGVARIEAGHFQDNAPSGKVLRRCGFRETGLIEATPCAGRAGDIVPTIRFERRLAQDQIGQAA